jgi:hypothetical protein
MSYQLKERKSLLAIREWRQSYFILARVSLTAAQNRIAVRGIQATKIPVVRELPNSGIPELNSNTEPTAAIAAMQEPSKKTPLLGVTVCSPQDD